MGGFQKYPIPRYVLVIIKFYNLQSDAWMYNRRWFRNTCHVLIPTAIISFLIYRGGVTS